MGVRERNAPRATGDAVLADLAPRLSAQYRAVSVVQDLPHAKTLYAEQLATGQRVVIKLIVDPSLSPGTRTRLEHEAQIRHGCRHNALPEVLDFGALDDGLYIVMRFVEGVPLGKLLTSGPLSVRDTLLVAQRVLTALDTLHANGVLHRDVRPANVMVPAPGTWDAAMLVNVGTVREFNPEQLFSAREQEILAYMSPEQAGSLDQDVGEASDLYSTGVLLFHCLAGRPPFIGQDAGTLLFEHLTARVPDLPSLNSLVPRALDELVQRLLRKDPQDRYQLAKAALADVAAILAELDNPFHEAPVVIGASDRRGTLTEPAFVARADEIALFDELMSQSCHGSGGVMLIEGESGCGKSRLLVEVAKQSRRQGLRVLRGQGTTQVGQRPFRMLEGVIGGVQAACQEEPAWAAALCERLSEHLGALCAAIPELRQILAAEQAEQDLSPAAFGEARTIQALAALLDALGDAARPAIIILDDCQWADELTYKLIRRWQATSHERRYVSLIVAFRSEEVPANHILRGTPHAAHCQLAPFAPHEIQQLAESMAGTLPAQALEVVTRLADGSPFMASALMRGLVETRALIPDSQGWRVEPLALADLQSSRQAASILTRRIELLSDETLRVLSVGAVIGKEFNLDIATRLTELTPAETIQALTQARQRHLIWTRPDGGHFVFVHDQVRAALLNRLTADEQQALHLRAAHYLQTYAPEQFSEIAYHFDEAHDAANAMDYALRAADQARRQFALEIAERQYRIAQRGLDFASREIQFRVAEGLGDTLMLRGNYAAAAPLFEQAAQLADGPLAQAEIQGKLAELQFKRGDMVSATSGFERALRLLGWSVPQSVPAIVCCLLVEIVRQVLHTLFPKLLVHRVRRMPTEAEKLSLRMLSLLTHGCWYTRTKIQCLWSHLRVLNLAERFPPTLELAQAYSEHAPVMCLIPMFSRAIRYAERSLALRKSFGDVWGQGQSLNYHSCVLYAAARYRECVDKAREAIRLLERTGDYWQVHIARYQVAASLLRLGDLPSAIEEARLNHRSGIELGDEQTSGIILDVWVRASRGGVPDDVMLVELKRERFDAQGRCQVLLAEGIRQVHAKNWESAVATMEQAVRVFTTAGIRNAYTLPSLAWLATAYRCQAQETSPFTPGLRKRLIARGLRAARRSMQAARICRSDLPRALREAALLVALAGNFRRARRYFNRSLQEASAMEAALEHAETLLHRGRLGLHAGWPHAAEDIQRAEHAMLTLTASLPSPAAEVRDRRERATVSLIDRFDTVLETGRRIASALSKSVIYDEARAAALRLLRGEQCLLLECERDDATDSFRCQLALGPQDSACSLSMIDSAIRNGRAVAFVEELAGPPHATQSHGERSAICVPIQVRGRAVACLYVTNQHVRGLFGLEEERLADFVAVIAGAALENAEGVHQLECLNATLEQRVAERTAAAEAANEAKSRFLATMSHEIRTPMNGILGMTDLALRTSMSQQQRHYLNVVRKSGDALLKLLNDILDLSKIEAGRMDLEHIPFDLRTVAGDAVKLMGIFAAQKRIELICRVAPDVPRQIMGDPCRLRQVIVNLIGNAVKFTHVGEVFVDIFLERDPAGREQLRLSVRDTGPGIPADKQSLIFESFQQCDNSTTRRYGGTGLGLAISSQLVTLMDGRILLESTVGVGSTFHVSLPLHRAEEESAVASPTRLDHMLAVVWCANATARGVYREALEHAGGTVESCTSEAELLERLEQLEPARSCCLVIDVERRTSERVRAALRQRPQPIPVVAVISTDGTHATNEENLPRTEKSVAKPIITDELIQALQLVDTSRREPAGRKSSTEAPAQRRLKILLAEDSIVNQEVALGLFEVLGHSCVAVANGQQAVDALAADSFDVVFMDIEMPGLDGFEATRRIRARERNLGLSRTPVVAMTAHALGPYRDEGLEAGMDDYICKPFQPEVIVQVLEKFAPPAAAELPAEAPPAGPPIVTWPTSPDFRSESPA